MTEKRPEIRRRHAFTLVEMIVVIAIIVLLIGIAIPAVKALTGDRNTGAAFNQLSAVIGQARQDALALQAPHGVLFYLDPGTDRVTATLVQAVAPPASTTITAQVWLDLTPLREQLALPAGVGVQTIANTAAANTDRYIGFNPSSGVARFGGVILFDANGLLVSRTYCLLCNSLFGGGTVTNNTLVGGPPVPSTSSDSTFNGTLPQSQFGFVLFDRTAFQNLGYTDGDPGLDNNVGAAASYGSSSSPVAGTEAYEEQWLDTNSTPVLINRYNGTLIKTE